MLDIRLKRVYEPAEPADGMRVLVDRLWPRGLTKEEVDADVRMGEVAPSPQLRKWFGHRPERWQEFRRRYQAELSSNPSAGKLAEMAGAGRITLVYSARDEEHNQAVVLAEFLQKLSGSEHEPRHR